MASYFLELKELVKNRDDPENICFVRQGVASEEEAKNLLVTLKAEPYYTELFKGSYRAILHECRHSTGAGESNSCFVTILEEKV